MTIEEIFARIAQHMIKGLMVHIQLSDYFNFLGLSGYQKCHEYHYYDESKNFRHISDYYLKNFNRFITDSHIANPQVIPESWYKYTRQQVDASTRKTSIQGGFDKWISWETETKKLYQDLYKELLNMNEAAAADEIRCLLLDVSEELKNAQQKQLELKMIDYDISIIAEGQDYIYKKYEKKIEELFL